MWQSAHLYKYLNWQKFGQAKILRRSGHLDMNWWCVHQSYLTLLGRHSPLTSRCGQSRTGLVWCRVQGGALNSSFTTGDVELTTAVLILHKLEAFRPLRPCRVWMGPYSSLPTPSGHCYGLLESGMSIWRQWILWWKQSWFESGAPLGSSHQTRNTFNQSEIFHAELEKSTADQMASTCSVLNMQYIYRVAAACSPCKHACMSLKKSMQCLRKE